MGFQNLNLFVSLSETLNLRLTAERFQISVQYLSHYIKDLEAEYQVTLFYRKPRLCLTYEGELLLNAARDIQMYERNLEGELQDLGISDSTELHLGCSSDSIYVILPDLLSRYHATHPMVKIFLTERAEETQLSMLADGQLDLYLGTHPIATPEVELFPLPTEEIFLLVADDLLHKYFPNDYPLCAERFYRGIRLEDFSDLPFLYNRSEQFLYQTADRYCADHGLSLNYVLSSGSTEALLNLCRRGSGCLLCPMRHIPHQQYSNTVTDSYTYRFPVIDFLTQYHLDIAYSKNRHLPRYIIDFIHCATQPLNIPEQPESTGGN